MGAGSSDEDSLLTRAINSVGRGVTLDEAFSSLVQVLRVPLELWHMNLSFLKADAETGKIVAAWSMAPSAFEPGTEVSLSISDSARSSAEALRRGNVILASVPSTEDSLVDALLREQGVTSVAVVPIHRDAAGILVLTLGSSAEGPLQAAGELFFRGLAAGIEKRLLELFGSLTS